MKAVGVLAAVLSTVMAAPAADKVTAGLPNMTANFTDYDVYSGFLELTPTKKIYYLFE